MPEDLAASDLPIVLYLNQRVTFDLLATLEGGFARVTNVQESSSRSAGSELGGGIGISNAFALLGLTFGAQGKRNNEQAGSETTSEQLVHTPSSLFTRLRAELLEKNMVKIVDQDELDVTDFSPGEFVEIRAILGRSPLVIALDTILELAPLVSAFDADTEQKGQSRRSRSKQRGKQTSEMDTVIAQVKTLRKAAVQEGFEDLIADCGKRRLVLTTESAYFVDPTMNDVIDGTFRVFGKVTRVVTADELSGVSLLRRSALSKFDELPGTLEAAFAGFAEAGFTGERVQFEIPPPTMQVIPIAIFA